VKGTGRATEVVLGIDSLTLEDPRELEQKLAGATFPLSQDRDPNLWISARLYLGLRKAPGGLRVSRKDN